MRTILLLAAVAALAMTFDRFVTTPSGQPGGEALAQNAGPLPTAAVNPGLGAPPPGGHLGDTPAGAAGGTIRAPGGMTAPANARAPVGTMPDDRLGVPGTGAVANPPAAAVPPAPARAVAPPASGAVGRAPAGAVTAPASR